LNGSSRFNAQSFGGGKKVFPLLSPRRKKPASGRLLEVPTPGTANCQSKQSPRRLKAKHVYTIELYAIKIENL
jgi:hypothetical protein